MKQSVAKAIQKELNKLADKERAIGQMAFFKTKKGQYGFGDIFLGIPVPTTRAVLKPFYGLALPTVAAELLQSKYHEHRLSGVLLLKHLYKKYPKESFSVYIANTGFGKGINNWDLIDASAEYVVGPYLWEHMSAVQRKDFIETCLADKDLWIRRMIILATFYKIKNGDEKMITALAPKFLNDSHDLIHKAVGWMLREMGKRVDRKHLISFLEKYHSKMPRTMYRYAIEHLDAKTRALFN